MAKTQHITSVFLLLNVFGLVAIVSALKPNKLYITYDNLAQRFGFHDQKPTDAAILVAGSFTDGTNVTGWGFLELWTNGSYPDKLQAYGAGLAEGSLTQNMIYMGWHNTMKGFCQPVTDYCKRLSRFITDNAAWMTTQIAQHANTDPYWHQVDLFYTQLNGMRDGYNEKIKDPSQPLLDDPLDMFLLMQLGGDLEDLESALKSPTPSKVVGSGSCSALIKLLPDNMDLFAAQDTWNSFSAMLRILKKYDLNFKGTPGVKGAAPMAGHSMTLSSYPGSLTSGDDFYVLSSGMVTMETTIGNSNDSLWKFVKPTGSVFESVRSMVANRLTRSGKEWTKMFSMYNSGTYNNQWMVVDYKRFAPGQRRLDPELFYVLEQVPGHIASGSVTDVLEKQGYWPSYNVAYFPEIFKVSGNEAMVKKYGKWFTYNETARANIFRRDHVKVKDIDSMIKLMRYNDFTHDPLSHCNCTPPYSAENAISARSDLNPANGTYPFGALKHRNHGGTDMKMTSYSLAKTLDFMAVAGPTYDNVPAFQWSKADFGKTDPHLGHPDLWKFKPIQTSWKHPNRVPHIRKVTNGLTLT